MGIDIDLAESVVSSDYFSEVLEPQPIDLERLKKVLIIAPHQDDEAIGCGGLLSELSQRGVEITLVFVTDGRPISENPQAEIKIRSEESHTVAEILNANIIELGINNVSMEIDAAHVARLADICDNNWSGIFTTWVLDRPYKHRIINYLLLKAMKRLDSSTQVFCYQVHSTLIPNVIFDYTALIEKKQKLINVYQSQLKSQSYQHLSQGLDAWNSRFLPRSGKPSYAECYTQLPLIAFRELVALYDKNPKQTFHSSEDCLKAYNNLKTESSK